MAQAARSQTYATSVRKRRAAPEATKAASGKPVKATASGITKAAKPGRTSAKKTGPARAAAATQKTKVSPSAGRTMAKAPERRDIPTGKASPQRTIKPVAKRRVPPPAIERLKGSALGDLVSLEEGRRRIDAYVIPRPLESWAGPVAGAGEILQSLGVPRQTLSNWRKAKAAIGLPRGQRNLAYPLDQFVDARPVQGLAPVVRVAPSERAAWLWLRQPHAALAGETPLTLLKQGKPETVAKVAERDFV